MQSAGVEYIMYDKEARKQINFAQNMPQQWCNSQLPRKDSPPDFHTSSDRKQQVFSPNYQLTYCTT